jgi:hypothetical protein
MNSAAEASFFVSVVLSPLFAVLLSSPPSLLSRVYTSMTGGGSGTVVLSARELLRPALVRSSRRQRLRTRCSVPGGWRDPALEPASAPPQSPRARRGRPTTSRPIEEKRHTPLSMCNQSAQTSIQRIFGCFDRDPCSSGLELVLKYICPPRRSNPRATASRVDS